jgi:hypothetical protein
MFASVIATKVKRCSGVTQPEQPFAVVAQGNAIGVPFVRTRVRAHRFNGKAPEISRFRHCRRRAVMSSRFLAGSLTTRELEQTSGSQRDQTL